MISKSALRPEGMYKIHMVNVVQSNIKKLE